MTLARLVWRPAVAVLLTAAAVPALAAGRASAAPPGHRAVDDRRVVQATRVSSTPGASGLSVHRTSRAPVGATNTAVAYVTCDRCRAVALSFQVVIAQRSPGEVAAGNVALAVTEGCHDCESLAMAYQVVVTTDGRTHISARGHRMLDSVRGRLRALSQSHRPVEEIRTQADSLMAVVTQVVAEELRTRPTVRSRERWERTEPGARGPSRGGRDS